MAGSQRGLGSFLLPACSEMMQTLASTRILHVPAAALTSLFDTKGCKRRNPTNKRFSSPFCFLSMREKCPFFFFSRPVILSSAWNCFPGVGTLKGCGAGDSACGGQPVPQDGSRGKAMVAKLRTLERRQEEPTNSSGWDGNFAGNPVFSQLWMFLSGLSQCWAFK